MNKYIIPVALVMVLAAFAVGYTQGISTQKDRYHKEQIEINDQINLLKKKHFDMIRDHAIEQASLLKNLEDIKSEYESTVDSIRSDYDVRMLESEKRSNLYRARAGTSESECRALAGHTSRLDRSLTEGRELVREFKADLKQCRVAASQFIGLIENDRNLFNGNK